MVEVAIVAEGSRRRTTGPVGAERELLADRVYLALKEYVLDNVLAPGDRLNIDALAERLGVSPTPVREALARLAAEKLVTTESYRGYFVSPMLAPSELADLFDVRKVLEVHAVRRAATASSLSRVVKMERMIYEMGGPDLKPQFQEYRDFSILDQQLHEELVGLAESPALLNAWHSLNIHVQAARFFRAAGHVDVRQSVIEHAAILGALIEGDVDAAAAATEAHIDAGLRRSLRGVGSLVAEPDETPTPSLVHEGVRVT